MMVLLWASIAFHLSVERDHALQAARQSSANLVRAFEKHVIGSIRDTDNTMLFLRNVYQTDRMNFDIAHLTSDANLLNSLTMQISVLGPDGTLLESSGGAMADRRDFSGHEHFQFHARATDDQLFVGKPETDDLTGRKTLRLARRISRADGAFGGVIVALVDPYEFARFYESIDVGRDGLISLVGTDGIILANAGAKEDIVGRSLAKSGIFKRYPQTHDGFYFSSGVIEPIGRYVTFRKVANYPLLVTVGFAEHEVMGRYWQNRSAYSAVGAILTILIFVGIAFCAAYQRRLDAARDALQVSDARAREKSHELQVTLDHMNQGIMMIDPNNDVAVINRRAIELLGLPEKFLRTRPAFSELVNWQWESGEFGPKGKSLPPHIREAFERGDPGRDAENFECVRPDGTVLEITNAQLADGGVVRTFTDITERKRNIAQIAHMARHDPLTGLANRELLRERVELAMGRLRRCGERFALLCLDLDRFKAVNDTFGHLAGDALLRLVVERILCCVRITDTVARLGGDEFAVLVTMMESGESLAILVQQILQEVRKPYEIDGNKVEIGTSIGIAMAPQDGMELEELVHKADIALYRVKSEGRNNFRFFESGMEFQVQARRALERELRAALQRNEFELYYQPIYHLGTEKIVGFESLLRWNHPQRGVLPPSEFLAFAEEIGLIVQIGEWALRSACREAVKWPGHIKVSVNLSRSQINGRKLIECVTDALALSGLQPHRLQLEIGEVVFSGRRTYAFPLLQKLRDLDVGLVFDHFGAGCSALTNLRRFHFDKIKIDSALVSELLTGPDGIAIVVAIAGLARNLGGAMAADGVEIDEQIDLLVMAGCIEAQGNAFCPPRRAAELPALFAAEPRRVVA